MPSMLLPPVRPLEGGEAGAGAGHFKVGLGLGCDSGS